MSINYKMPGGLIQIASYGSQDLFLTGVPEITYFKIIYRRHTNFAIESVQVPFDDTTNFNGYTVLKVPKTGDLIHKVYLQIQLPAMNLLRETMPSEADVNDLKAVYQTTQANYQIITDFMNPNRNAFVSAYQIYIAENSTTKTTDMIQAINDVFAQEGNQPKIEAAKNLLTLSTLAPFTYNEISMDTIASLFDSQSSPDVLFGALEDGIDKSIKTQQYYYNSLLLALETLTDAQDQHIKFAWVKKIGHAIIDNIEVKIGGQKIDRHYGDWLNIWHELNGSLDMENIYNELIGNVDVLTNFDRSPKPTYLLKIPLQFWFNRFSGLALPLISLEYHDVTFHVKFRPIEQVAYIEAGTNIKYSQVSGGVTLDEVPTEIGLDIIANMLIDYVYLDISERKRFAQSSHEYMIEQTQILEKNNVTQQQIQFTINNFVHPTKEIIWVSQKEKYRVNNDSTNQCMWDNYSLTPDGNGNPIIYSSLDFHSYKRIPKLSGNYFNYLQPYQCHHKTPSDGINCYSFSLFPEDQQPSGTANLSRLTRIVLYLEFSQTLFINSTITDTLCVRVYIRNVNILRFINGFAGLAYNY